MIVWELNYPSKQLPYAYIDDAFTKDECDLIKNIGDGLETKSATVNNNNSETENFLIRKTEISWISPEKNTSWLFRQVTDLIDRANADWFKYDLIGFEHLQYSIYNVGDLYKIHSDTMYEGFLCRKLSFTIQLSDPTDYEGGDVELFTGNKTPLILNKNIGSISFFSSYILHEVKPVTKGTRKALVGWVHGPQWR